jgi:cell wall-associated NlpC family hydrolase
MLIALVISFSPRADAQIRRRVRIRTAAIALQPFTVGPRLVPSGRPSSFAYYSPRSIYTSRHNAIDSDDDETNTVSAPVQSSGSHPTVGGSRAVLRNGVAYAPAGAPDRVKSAIWAVNNIRHKPYVWGGGHGSFDDRGYDCSGTVSYALHHAGLLSAPLPSSDLMRYGERGRGRWITVYARNGHTFAMIAGLRLDTTDFRYGGDVGPRWHTDSRSTGGFVATHPVGL